MSAGLEDSSRGGWHFVSDPEKGRQFDELIGSMQPELAVLAWQNFIKRINNGVDKSTAHQLLLKELETNRGQLKSQNDSLKKILVPSEGHGDINALEVMEFLGELRLYLYSDIIRTKSLLGKK